MTNTATVSGGGDVNTGNNTRVRPDDDRRGPDLTITKTHTRQLHAGPDRGDLHDHGHQRGNASTNAPGDRHRYVARRTDGDGPQRDGLELHAGDAHVHAQRCPGRWEASFPVLTLTVTVATDAAASLVNTATVAGGGDTNLANNTATDPTNVIPVTLVPD